MLKPTCRIIVGLCERDCIQLFEADCGFQARLGIGQVFELLIGCFEVRIRVAFALPAFVVGDGIGEQARPMEVQVGGKALDGELVDLVGVGSGNMRVTELLADDRSILSLLRSWATRWLTYSERLSE